METKFTTNELWTILKSVPLGILIANENGLIVFSNKEANNIFYEDINGLSIEDLVPSHYRDKHVELRKKYMSNPVPRKMGVSSNVIALRRNGERFSIEIALQPFSSKGDNFIIAWFYDVSTKKELENELENISRLQDITMNTKERLDDVIKNLRNMA